MLFSSKKTCIIDTVFHIILFNKSAIIVLHFPHQKYRRYYERFTLTT